MSLKIVYFSFFLVMFSCNTTTEEPKIEIWGNDSTGYCVRTLDKTGKEYFKWSDLASDTASMRVSARTWYLNQKY